MTTVADAPRSAAVQSTLARGARRPLSAKVGAYIRLTKPRVIELLLVTAVPPMILAQQGWPSLGLIAAVVIGGAMAAGGANTINCWIERDRDQLMRRTLSRPLPQGEIVPSRALAFGIVLNVLAFVLLATAANVLAAVLTLSATLFYVFVYTLWLKPRTVQNIVIGGAAGAVPALVGWAAVRGSLASPAWLLFAVVFFWTPAHFWALAVKYRDDYAAAGIPMLPVVRGIEETTRQIAGYAMVTVAVTFAMPPGRPLLRGVGLRAGRALRRPGARAHANSHPPGGDQVLRMVERVPDAGVRRGCGRRARPVARPPTEARARRALRSRSSCSCRSPSPPACWR
jgi:protoheme IX farnesyltransferase